MSSDFACIVDHIILLGFECKSKLAFWLTAYFLISSNINDRGEKISWLWGLLLNLIVLDLLFTYRKYTESAA